MKIHATGPRAGKTFTWKPHPTSDMEFQFVEGVCDIQLPANELPGVLTYLRRMLQIKTDLEMPRDQSVTPPAPGEEADPIRLAILSLDADDDSLWTDAGTATVDAVAMLIPTVTREAIDAVASDLTRAVVRGGE